MFRHFKNGRTLTDGCYWSDLPTASRSKPFIVQVKNIVHGGYQLTQEVAEGAEISTGSGYTILMEDLEMHWVSAKYMPRFLLISETTSEEQMTMKILFKNVITSYETTALMLEWSCYASPQESMTGVPTTEISAASFISLGNEYYEFARKGQTIRISTWKI
jgi:hypothetical protein